MHSSTIAVRGLRPNGRPGAALEAEATVLVAAAIAGGRPRISSASAPITSPQNTPHAQVGLAPAHGLDEVLHDGRPHRASQVIAAGAHRHRDAAALDEPKRGVGHQRCEGRGAAEEADEHRVHRHELADVAHRAGQQVTHAEAQGADQERPHHAMAVGQLAHQDAADTEADHQRRVRQ
jgi:hypothetical protein